MSSSPLIKVFGLLLAAAALVGAAVAVRNFSRVQTTTSDAARPASSPPRVAVSIAPLKGLVAPLLPPGTNVDVLVPPGVSEHGYEPPPDRLTAMAQADVVILVGLGLDSRARDFLAARPREGAPRIVLELASLLREDLIAAGVPADAITSPIEHRCEDHDHDHDHADHIHDAAPQASKDAGHDHADGSDHAHAAADPHIWLDPVLAAKAMAAIARELRAHTPADPGREAREQAASAAMAELARDFDSRLASCDCRVLVVAHDAYGWLARRYNLQTVPISGLNAGEPTSDALAAAARALVERRALAVFSESQLSRAAAERLVDVARQAGVTDVRALTLDPLGDGDYLALMRRNLDALTMGLGCGAGSKGVGAATTASPKSPSTPLQPRSDDP